jgi:hypothetical protein
MEPALSKLRVQRRMGRPVSPDASPPTPRTAGDYPHARLTPRQDVNAPHDQTSTRFDPSLSRRYPPCSIWGMRPFHSLRRLRQSALPGSPNGSRKPLVDPTPNPQSPKMNPSPAKIPARFTPTARSSYLCRPEINRKCSPLCPKVIPSMRPGPFWQSRRSGTHNPA